MKKINYILVFTIVVGFISIFKVNAATYYIKDNCQNMDNGMGQVCSPQLIVEGENVKFNKIELNFQMIGVTFDSKNVSLSEGFKIQNATDISLTIITSKTIFAPGTYDIGTISFYKITSATICNIIYSYQFINESRSCEIINGIYYDKEGNETDKLTYQKQCEINVCKILTDGTSTYYYGKDGTEVSKEVYEEQCLEKKYCVVEDGKYYDKEGNETTKEMYDYLCNKHYCEIIQINDTTEYYDKSGNQTDKSTYESECLENKKCIKENDKYYGENGEEIDKITFEKICQKNVCTKLEDGTFYGKNGIIVDEITYNIECNINICKVVGDKYFDDKGNIVSEDEYKKACDNPQTGDDISYTTIIIGIIGAGILFFIAKKYNKLKNI